MSEADEQPSRPPRRLLIDLTPLRRSRDFRHLVSGELVSVLGTQLTTVAVPYQVYQLTRSSLDVGLVSITQLFPLIAGSLLAGSVVDAMDRRRLLMVAQVLMAGCSAGLAVNADLGPSLWPLFVLPALAAGFSGLDSAGRNAIVPNLVRRSEVSTANAIFQALFQLGLVAGPALAGLLLAGRGRPLRVLAGRGQLRGGPGGGVPDLAAAGREARPPPGPALDPRGSQLRARQAVHPGRLPDRHQRHGVRHAAGPVPGARHDRVRRRRVDARLPLRRARRGRPGRRAHHRLGQPDPAPGPGGHRRGHRLGRRHHLLRAGALAARRPGCCSPPRAAPTSSRRCSAARSSSSPCRTHCGDAWRACRSPWSPAVPASGTWSQGWWQPPSATPYRSYPAAWPASRAPWCWPACCPASAASEVATRVIDGPVASAEGEPLAPADDGVDGARLGAVVRRPGPALAVAGMKKPGSCGPGL